MVMKSDVFDIYAKIAEENGIISLADDEPKESSKLKKYKKSPYPRMGSDDISTIEAMYGIKPDDTVIKYEHNIMEAAHPKPVVIAPAYDRLNALVENNIERQNIMINIINKPTDGKINSRKYASKELLMELVRLANDLDNSNHDELRLLADNCILDISNLEKKKYKKADIGDWLTEKEKWLENEGHDAWQTVKGLGTGGLIGGIIGSIFNPGGGTLLGAELGAAAGGLLAAIFRTTPQVRNVAYNASDTMGQVSDIKNKIAKISGNDIEYNFLDSFEKELNNIKKLSVQYNGLVSSIQTDKTNLSPQEANTITNNLFSSMDKINEFILQFNDKINRRVYETYINHSKALTPLYRFISDDIEDVKDSISSLSTSINNLKISMSAAGKEAKSVLNEDKTQENTDVKKPKEYKDYDDIGKDTEEESPKDEEDNSWYSNVTKELGHKPLQRELDFIKSLK